MWIMRDYDLTEEKAVEISAKLAKRKEKPTSFYQTNKLASLLASRNTN